MSRLFSRWLTGPSRTSTRIAILVFVPVVAVGSMAGTVYVGERTKLKAWSRQTWVNTEAGEARFIYECEEPRMPPTRPAIAATIDDNDEVIGVEVDGKARAYWLATMADKDRHIVNDVVADTPITVTYCNRSQCVRAFSGKPGDEPLAVRQAGVLGGKMVLRVNGVGYIQNSGEAVEYDTGVMPVPFPYQESSHTRTSWKAWKTSHPDTDVYVGEAAAAPSPRTKPAE